MALNLNDVPDFDGLPIGEHTVKVTGYEGVTNPGTGNEGYTFKVEDRHGRKHKVTIWTTKDNGASPNLISLKRFARACGLTEQQLGRWEPNMMAGKYFLAHVEQDKRKPEFTVIERYEKTEVKAAAVPPAPIPAPPPAPPPQPTERQPGEDDDKLPF